MFKKFLAGVGIGSAKVDTQLDKTRLVPGENTSGKVVIQGGKVEQQVDRIHLFVMTEAVRERDDKKYYEKVTIGSFQIASSFIIQPGEEKEIDFQFELPIDTPPTLGKTKVWIQTGLDVPSAIDPTDRDYITVDPHPIADTVLEALTKVLGFQLRKVEMEYSRRYRYVQEFEFYPGGEFRRDLDELEVIFFMNTSSADLRIQVDRRAKGLGGLFAEALDMDESFVRLSISNDDCNQGIQYVADILRNTIRQYA